MLASSQSTGPTTHWDILPRNKACGTALDDITISTSNRSEVAALALAMVVLRRLWFLQGMEGRFPKDSTWRETSGRVCPSAVCCKEDCVTFAARSAENSVQTTTP